MMDVLRFWLKRGVDGFRSDAAYHLAKDKQFRDDLPNLDYRPGQDEPYEALLHTYSKGQAELAQITNAFCNVLSEHSHNTYLVSEAYLGLPQMLNFYNSCKNSLHAPLNFNLMTLPWTAESFKKFIDEFEMKLRPNDWPNYVLGNHDRSRIATRLGQERARLMAMLMLTLRGMPFIYYGDELGMEDVIIPAGKELDPWGKNMPGFKVGRDPERNPMQWNTRPNAGFTSGEPWLPVSTDYKEKNVETEYNDERSLFSLYKKLIHYHTSSPALLTGAYRALESGNENIFEFNRECASEKLLIALNFSDQEQSIIIPAGQWTFLCNTYMDKKRGESMLSENLMFRAYEGYIFKVD